MRGHYPVSGSYLLLALLLTGCDFSETEQPTVVDRNDDNISIPRPPKTPAEEAIDLTISPEMMEALQQDEGPLTQTEAPPTSFKNTSSENEISFGGKLHLDEDKDTEYLDSLDGAEVNINVKFK